MQNSTTATPVALADELRLATADAAENRKAEERAMREAVILKHKVEAKAVIAAFHAHTKVGNIGGMEAALRKLRDAELQAGLIWRLGSVAKRDEYLLWCQREICLVMRAKLDRRKK